MVSFNKSYKRILLIIALGFAAAAVLALLFARRLGGRSMTDAHLLHISEVMTRNDSFPNGDGVCCDWIEITNTSGSTFDLGGYMLTDEPGEGKYTFPTGTQLKSGEYLLVYCSTAYEGEGYASFGLSRSGGETVAILSPAAVTLDHVVTLPSEADVSQIRDGEGFALCETPTPGFPNTPEGYAQYLSKRSEESAAGAVRLNEIVSSNGIFAAADGGFYDWIELYNESERALDLSGYGLSDREDEIRYRFPAGTVIEGHGCLVVWCDSDADNGWCAPFSLRRNGGETVTLFAPNADVLDSVTLPALEKNGAYVRSGGEWVMTLVPTPGQ